MYSITARPLLVSNFMEFKRRNDTACRYTALGRMISEFLLQEEYVAVSHAKKARGSCCGSERKSYGARTIEMKQ